jgi:hypothetical protein
MLADGDVLLYGIRTKGGLQFVLCELVVMVAIDAIEQCEQLLFGFVHEFPEFCGDESANVMTIFNDKSDRYTVYAHLGRCPPPS